MMAAWGTYERWTMSSQSKRENIIVRKQIKNLEPKKAEIYFHGKLGVMRVVTSQLRLTRPFSLDVFFY